MKPFMNRLSIKAIVIGISLSVLLQAAVTFAQMVSFGAAKDFAVGPGPFSVAIGDLNGDGIPDLAVANLNSNTVSILLGTGTGAFGSATDVAVGTTPDSSPYFVAIGDLNGDGIPDLTVANSNYNSVSILLGDGTGAFVAATDFAVGAFPTSVAIGDFNGDGIPDLAVANYNSDTVSILLGTGTGAFGASTDFAVGPGPISVAIGDLNGDGIPDLAVANTNSNTVSILLGDGSGAFGTATDFAAGNFPIFVAIGDLNGDGIPDLVLVNYLSNTVSILLGTGNGAFGASTDFAVGQGPYSVAIGDLDGDGKPDLAVANSNSNTVSVLVGDGTGAFVAAPDIAVGQGPYSVAIGDLNGDGWPDLAVPNFNNDTVSVLLNTPPQFSLLVNKADTGSGTVISIPPGINCGASCSASFPSGMGVTLSASANPGSTFTGWTGPNAAECATGSVLMNANKSCTANFTLTTYTLTLTTAGTGSGTVSGAGTYNDGQTASVSATANPGSTYTSWTGPNSAECATGSVLMNADKSCTATFTLNTYTLTLATAGTGSGTVSGAGTYNYGQTATVTATANAGSTFSGWTGPNAAECATGPVLMNANKSCTATFTLNTYTLTLNKAGTGSGTVSGAGTYNDGQTATVTATANAGSTFSGWSGPDAAKCTTGSVLMNANMSCTATFTHETQPDLIMTDITPNAATAKAGATLSVTDTVKNQGSSSRVFRIAYHLSANTTYGDGDDVVIPTIRVVTSLGAGASSTAITVLSIPTLAQGGTYFLCAKADSLNQVSESDETNNTLCSGAKVTLPKADLIVSALSTTATTVKAGRTINVSYSIKNQGATKAGSSVVAFHLSIDAAYGGGDDVASHTTRRIGSLAINATRPLSTVMRIPVTTPPGTYYVCVQADTNNSVAETDETNNTRCTTTKITVTP